MLSIDFSLGNVEAPTTSDDMVSFFFHTSVALCQKIFYKY